MGYWQQHLLDDLISYFRSRKEVSGLLLFGSLGNPELHADDWSDIDLLVVVKEGKLDQFFPSVEWLAAFGGLYTYSQSADDDTSVTRACFDNFNRVDFVITTEEKLAEVERWSGVPFSSGLKVLFSRSQIVDEFANRQDVQERILPASEDQFVALVREFRFKSMLAV